ncbi:hypothetical protein ACOSP7_023128 [Xanthoceras sorbifolium]
MLEESKDVALPRLRDNAKIGSLMNARSMRFNGRRQYEVQWEEVHVHGLVHHSILHGNEVAPTFELGSKAVEEVVPSSPLQEEGIKEVGVRVGYYSNGVPDMVTGGFEEVLPMFKVSKKRLSSGVGGLSPTGGGNPSRGEARWKRRAMEKMAVDGGVAGLVLSRKRAGPFVADPEDQVVSPL